MRGRLAFSCFLKHTYTTQVCVLTRMHVCSCVHVCVVTHTCTDTGLAGVTG